MKKIIQLLLLLIVNFSFSQNNKFALTLSIPHLVDPYDGTSVRLGFDVPFRDMIINLEYGQFLSGDWALKTNTKGFIINPSIKSLVNINKRSKEYVGFDYIFKNYSYNTYDTIKSNNIEIRKEYKITRVVNGIALKYYRKYNLNKYLFFDMHVGLGIRYIISKSNLNDEEKANILDDEYHRASQIHNEINRTGNFLRPTISFGGKLGFNLF